MKKIVILMLCLTLILCGCGSAPAETTAPKTPETTAPAVTTPATTVPETTVPETTVPETTVEETIEETDAEDEARVLAESCIDKSVEELFKLIGQPDSSDYAPSCLDENGEDGMLYYENFIVYTFREGDSEIVTFVE